MWARRDAQAGTSQGLGPACAALPAQRRIARGPRRHQILGDEVARAPRAQSHIGQKLVDVLGYVRADENTLRAVRHRSTYSR